MHVHVLFSFRLSELNVDLYLKQKRKQIEVNYQIATELRNRLEKTELDKVLVPLNNMRAYHREFLQKLLFHVIDRHTSTIGNLFSPCGHAHNVTSSSILKY